MKLGTQSMNTSGTTAFASGIPMVLPTNPNSPFAKLIVKSELGQIVQQWLVLQNKCTLGSASSCALRCQLPGIAPYHALLVMGSRQVFIRALAPKLSRNGVMVNELLLTEDQNSFEIAGHQFELIRNVKVNEPASSSNSSPGKLKFALARPMEIGQARQPIIATQAQSQSIEQPRPHTAPSSELQPQWITDLIQSAMLPLERQLHDIIEPLTAMQSELDKRAKLARKRRKRLAKQFESQENALTTQQVVPVPEPVTIPIISPEVQSQLAKQSETLGSLNAQLTEVKSNLGSLERVVSENFATVIDAASAPVPTPEPVNEALQRITSVSEQLRGLTSQLDDVRSNLGSLERIVSENLASTNELRTAPEPASNEALQRLSEVANQLSVQLQDVCDRQISTVDTDQAWREQLCTQIGELKETVTATETSILKSTEDLLSTSKETCHTFALMADGHLKFASQSTPIQTAIQSVSEPVAIATITEQIESPIELAISDFAEQTIQPEEIEVAPPAFDFGVNQVVDFGAEEVVEELPVAESNNAVEAESPANLFTQFAWDPEPTEETACSSSPASPTTAWDVQESPSSAAATEVGDTSASFIEEMIEECPLDEEPTASALPAWWTDDDKTQFTDDSAVIASPESSASVESPASAESPATQSPLNVEPISNHSEFERAESASEASIRTVDSEEPASAESINFRSAWNVDADVEDATTAVEMVTEQDLLGTDESHELSSLLERFGIVREPVSEEPSSMFDEQEPTAEFVSEAIVDELPKEDFEVLVRESEENEAAVIEQAEVGHVEHEPMDAPEAVLPPAEANSASEGGEEESIEDYMKRLMARMRGGSEEEVQRSSPSAVTPAPVVAKPPVETQTSAKIAIPAKATERVTGGTTAPFNPDEYVPKAFAPEKTRNLAAMRELANTSARSAIQVSARRRYGTAIALKLAIALIGLGVGATLVMINGLNVNIGLIATVASFLVALIWGFDAFGTLKPLLYSAVETSGTTAQPAEAEKTTE